MLSTSNPTKHIALVLAVSALLNGCATSAQRQFQAMVSNDRTAIQDLQVCAMAIYESPEYAPLRRHVPYKVSEATLEQLSDNSLATGRAPF
jgi:hypothetical protein